MQKVIQKLLNVQVVMEVMKFDPQNMSNRKYMLSIFPKHVLHAIRILIICRGITFLLINDAEQKGIEISDVKFKLRDAKQALFESRTMVHSFDQSKFSETIDKGLNVTTSVTQDMSNAIV